MNRLIKILSFLWQISQEVPTIKLNGTTIKFRKDELYIKTTYLQEDSVFLFISGSQEHMAKVKSMHVAGEQPEEIVKKLTKETLLTKTPSRNATHSKIK